MNIEEFKNNFIVSAYSGSIAYGTNTPLSDVDVRGIFVANPINLLTPFYPVDELIIDVDDTKYYELNKFMALLIKNNPNILELLFVNDEHIINKHVAFDLLRNNREMFLTKKIAYTTTGYAHDQLTRIKSHYKFITNPQSIQKPVPIDYFKQSLQLSKRKDIIDKHVKNSFMLPITHNIYGLYLNISNKYSAFTETGDLTINLPFNIDNLPDPDYIFIYDQSSYLHDKKKWDAYWQWKQNRNKKRAYLEEQFGYDTKHACHLVRLLRIGVEVLRDGVYNVYRNDAEELKSILNGSWSYDELLKYSDHMNFKIKQLIKTTSLPNNVDVEKTAKLIMQIQNLVWS